MPKYLQTYLLYKLRAYHSNRQVVFRQSTIHYIKLTSTLSKERKNKLIKKKITLKKYSLIIGDIIFQTYDMNTAVYHLLICSFNFRRCPMI